MSTLFGVAAFGAAGWLLEGWWWAAAGAGIAAVIASQVDHRMGYPIVLASLACCVGAAAGDHHVLLVSIVAGAVASIELAAAADRVNVVRPRVPVMGRTAASVGLAVALATTVVFVGRVEYAPGGWAAIAAAAVAVGALRLLVR